MAGVGKENAEMNALDGAEEDAAIKGKDMAASSASPKPGIVNVKKEAEEEEVVPEGWYRDDAGKLRPKKGEAMSFDFDMGGGGDAFANKPKLGGGGGKGGALQDRFKMFRKEKLKAAKEKASREKDAGEARKDPAAKQELRDEFIEQCKKYYGVPYAKRYHEPDSPHYNSPIFLDCCGLVRQVLRDLKDDFGFETGPWNQAYQFDTLPIRYDTWDQMKPGDLVFAEGKYIKEGVKPQKGDIVHIEVFLGGGSEGKSCCGARWGKGVIQEFDSWEFVAKSWTVKKWHFCSLDTWLEGVCRSFHPEREWKRREWIPGTRSIFNAGEDGEEDGEEEDEGAGDAEDGPDGTIAAASATTGASSKQRASAQNLFYVSRGNQWDLVSDCLEARGWNRIPFDEKSRNDYTLRWTEIRSDIDYTRFSDKTQLVNHIPNAQVITSKLQLIKTLRDRQRQIRRGVSSDNTGKEGADGKVMGPLKIEEYLPPSYSLTLGSDKIELLNHMQAGLRGEDNSTWIIKPASANCGRGIVVTRDYEMVLKEHLCWIKGKKNALPCDGPHIGEDGTESTPPEGKDEASADVAGGEGYFGSNGNEAKIIIQRYIPRPLLLGGRKFDIRCYMLIASTRPYLVLFRGGYVRRSLSQYSEVDLSDRFAHLTNAAVQKKHADYEEMKEDSIWSMDTLQSHLESSGEVTKGWVQDVLTPQLRRVCSEVFQAAKPKLQRRRGFFELLGVDFLVDADLRPWLLEVNTNPALWVSSEVQKAVIPPLVRDTVSVALSAWDQTKDGSTNINADTLEGMEGFDVIYDESNKPEA